MVDPDRQDVTLNTLHGDLMDVKTTLTDVNTTLTDVNTTLIDVKTTLTDVKTTLVAGFRSLPSRESSDEMVRLLREGNRLNEERLTRLDVRIREQHLETQQVQHATQQILQALAEGQRQLSVELRALIARIDALIRGRDNGNPPT
jgi:ABC-type molybdenum transport system ATPase subunit/photorepair protein PhrA